MHPCLNNHQVFLSLRWPPKPSPVRPSEHRPRWRKLQRTWLLEGLVDERWRKDTGIQLSKLIWHWHDLTSKRGDIHGDISWYQICSNLHELSRRLADYDGYVGDWCERGDLTPQWPHQAWRAVAPHELHDMSKSKQQRNVALQTKNMSLQQ
jgi:hypothetical protein